MAKRGPNTDNGRDAVRRNAVTHGILSPSPVVDAFENEREWQRHLAGMYESWEPETHQERVFVDRIANLAWRLKRVERFDTDTSSANFAEADAEASRIYRFYARLRDTPDDEGPSPEYIAHFQKYRLIPNDKVTPQLVRYEAHLHRLMIQTMHELEAMQDRRRGRPTPLARLDITGGPD